ncbi:MAG: helix-turn-helix domain-containing protein [Planctomycetes bacterium]|nr:helix-turn-helix domain-containing protein [Planctomycetota bacterium]
MSRIVKAMQAAIIASGQTRYAISKQTGIDQAHLSRFMTGEKGLSFDAMERLADCLGLEITLTTKTRRQTRRQKRK